MRNILSSVASVFNIPAIFGKGVVAAKVRDEASKFIFEGPPATGKVLGVPSFSTMKRLRGPFSPKTPPVILGLDRETGDPDGVPLDGHLITIAPSRPGAADTQIIPNSVFHDGPVVVYDRGGEALRAAAHWRSSLGGFSVCALDPFSICRDEEAAKFVSLNPLDFIRPETVASDVDAIMDALFVPPEGKVCDSDHFRTAAKRVIRGLILRALHEEPERRNLITVREWLLEPIEDLFYEMAESQDPVIRSAGSLLTSVDKAELNSILITAQSALQWLGVPRLAAAVEKSTIDLHDLRKGRTDLFVCIPRHMGWIAKPFIRLALTMTIATAMRWSAEKRILVMIDEAHEVGRIDLVEFSSGLNLSVWSSYYTLGDLERTYGRETAQSMLHSARAVSVYGGIFNGEEISSALGGRVSADDLTGLGPNEMAVVTQRHGTFRLGIMPTSR